ncbi:carboxypeptidase-like regulatory domain-containing protein [Olivibacter sp. SDN3]|uniref:carboxypeptidase-like regulatory domain-containing protein n=1 Tax=Olivibacter sp. SDN3 TaxID=2764720 RepID=UPI0016515720|nr:carboxypeptidase-like regulatory domain-containing protein [Olivibacter sp. SDN3]QNL47816.1 carboxypeptidase-like regulatory domain-containing protein [Olivibacter sp. SDN3]
MSLTLSDTSRLYKPATRENDRLHYRPVDLDIWYPSSKNKGEPMHFGELFTLFEQRAVAYQDNEDYSGITNELAQYYVAELGLGMNGQDLLHIVTDSYVDLPVDNKQHPIIIYMAGLNGMGFENYKVLEKLAQSGFVVVSIWSVGQYPGNMTNEMKDMMEQVYDAEFALEYLKEKEMFNIDFDKIGVLGCSWGGMGGGVLLNRNPNIKAMVSFDGSESHYFGDINDRNLYANEADGQDNDEYINAIHKANLLNPESLHTAYLYFESGDKLNEFVPTAVYDYYKKSNAEKYYLRFTDSRHEDFICIPSVLNASDASVNIYTDLTNTALAFFNKILKSRNSEFNQVWTDLITKDNISIIPFQMEKSSTKSGLKVQLSGHIVDARSKTPLQYANIGILDREIGTVSDDQGKFSLTIEKEYENDTLKISSTGYKPSKMLIKDITTRSALSVALEEETNNLDEVIITAKGVRKQTLGNKTKSRFLSAGFRYNQLGAEMGIKINIRKKPTMVEAFNFNIPHNRLSAGAVFRLNFYSVEDNRPLDNILTKNILIAIEPKQTGLVTVDLKDYGIVLRDDVIVMLEWVASEGKNHKGEAIFFSLGLLGNGTMYKESSQAKYKKYGSLGVGFNIEVSY